MSILKTIFVAVTITTLSGCAHIASPVGNGLIFTSVQGPVAATTSNAASKSGSACASNLLGLFAFGDASIKTAKADGNITTVSSVDHRTTTFLGIFGSFCTVVTGD